MNTLPTQLNLLKEEVKLAKELRDTVAKTTAPLGKMLSYIKPNRQGEMFVVSSKKPKNSVPAMVEAKAKAPPKNISTGTAPVSLGSQIRTSYIQMSNTYQRETDVCGPTDPLDGCRVKFCDMVPGVIGTDNTATLDGLFNVAGTVTRYKFVTPTNMGGRLVPVASLYQYYAFREIDIYYVPSCASSTNGVAALGYLNSVASYVSAVTAPSVNAVLETEPSIMTSVWMTAMLKIRFSGRKVWGTNAASGNIETWAVKDYVQGLLLSQSLNTALNTSYGVLRVCGVVDFYKQTPPFTTVSLQNRLNWAYFRNFLDQHDDEIVLRGLEWYASKGKRVREKVIRDFRSELEEELKKK